MSQSATVPQTSGPPTAEAAPPEAGAAPNPPAGDAGPARKVRTRGAFFGAACISLQPVILSAIMLPVTAYVIRGLGPTGYGQWAMATTLVAVVTFVTNLGLRGAFVRAVARAPESAAVALAEQFGARVLLSALAAGLAVLACVLLGYSQTVVLCTALSAGALVLSTISTTAADLLQALQRLPTVALVNLVAGLVLTAASVTAIACGAGPVGVAASYIAGPATSLVLLFWIVRRQHFPLEVRWNLRRSGTLLWDARFIAAQQLVWSASQHAESLMIPRMVGPTAFGFFSAGALLANRLTAIPEGLSSAAYPAMVAAYRDGARPALRVFAKFMALVLATAVPAAAAVSFLAWPIAELLFPGRAELCYQVMRITIWLLPAMGLHFILGYLLNALDRDEAQARMSLVASLFNLGMTATLVLNFGIIGACWSMVLRYVVHLVLQVPYAVWALRPLLAAQPAPAAPAAGVPQVATA